MTFFKKHYSQPEHPHSHKRPIDIQSKPEIIKGFTVQDMLARLHYSGGSDGISPQFLGTVQSPSISHHIKQSEK